MIVNELCHDGLLFSGNKKKEARTRDLLRNGMNTRMAVPFYISRIRQ